MDGLDGLDGCQSVYIIMKQKKKKVAKKMAVDRANFVRSAGDKGLAELLLIKEGLF